MKKVFILSFVFLSIQIYAQERGAPIFSDSFDTKDTFAENWVIGKGWTSRIKSENGHVVFPGGGTLSMRRDTPDNFYVEMEVTINKNEKSKDGFCGLLVGDYKFLLRYDGRTWMIYKLEGKSRAQGKVSPIDGFEFGKPVKMTLIRQVKNGVAQYTYIVNGKDAGNIVVPASDANLSLWSNKIYMTVDNFNLYDVKSGSGDSPNIIINSSFEHALDAFPLYFGRSSFDFAKTASIPYENYLATWSLDVVEKHSGKQSLKLVKDGSVKTEHVWVQAAGTIKDASGVFSVWMKADQDDFPVSITYGSTTEVKVSREWKRYEIVNRNLPAPKTVSPIRITLRKKNGTVWIDDLQAEFLEKIDETKSKSGDTLASPYKPSNLDKLKFGKQETPVRTAEITVKKLPAGLVPNGNLDIWKDKATKLNKFYNKLDEARNKTEVYIACDDDRLYIGYRCFVTDLAAINMEPGSHDSFKVFGNDGVEFFLDPVASGNFYQFATDAGGTRLEMGKGRDLTWNGDWKTNVKVNKETNSIDYEITIPFSTLSDAFMKSRWLVNFCRNDKQAKQHTTITKMPIVRFQQTEYWPYAQLPPDIVARHTLGVSSGAYSNNDKETSISLEVRNITAQKLSVTAELYDVQNPSGIIAKKDITLEQGLNNITFTTEARTNKVRLRLTDKGTVLADQTVMLKNHARLSILGRLSFYMNERDALFKVKTNVDKPEKMMAILECGGETVKCPAAGEFKIALPLKKIADGTHQVNLKLEKDGKTIASTGTTLIKRPYWKGASQINHFTRSVIQGGKPIFQFAPFFVMTKRRNESYAKNLVDWHDKYGFKYIHLLFERGSENDTATLLDYAAIKGIKVMLWSKYLAYPEDVMTETIKKLSKAENVISQMVLDEPELSITSDRALAFLRKMRPLFPYQPTQMNNTVIGIPNRYANLETDILMLDDYLTNRENRSVSSIVSQADVMYEAGAETGKPCYYFLVCSNFPLHYREPSYAEQVAQTYGCIAAGCTGLSYFYGDPKTPGNWRAMMQLNKEVQSLNDIILSEEEIGKSVSSGNPQLLRHITKKHQGFIYVISCNIDSSSAGTITFDLPTEHKYASEAEVLFENRNIKLKDGKFTDDFPAHSRHIYKVKIK